MSGRVYTSLEDRLLLNSDRSGACWNWTGRLNSTSGYGEIRLRGAYFGVAHRIAYETWVGPVPEGLQLDHLCRVRSCINPAHLEPVTQGENNRRGVGWAGLNARRMTCKRGHPFDEANTYVWRNSRICRACRKLRDAGALP